MMSIVMTVPGKQLPDKKNEDPEMEKTNEEEIREAEAQASDTRLYPGSRSQSRSSSSSSSTTAIAASSSSSSSSPSSHSQPIPLSRSLPLPFPLTIPVLPPTNDNDENDNTNMNDNWSTRGWIGEGGVAANSIATEKNRTRDGAGRAGEREEAEHAGSDRRPLSLPIGGGGRRGENDPGHGEGEREEAREDEQAEKEAREDKETIQSETRATERREEEQHGRSGKEEDEAVRNVDKKPGQNQQVGSQNQILQGRAPGGHGDEQNQGEAEEEEGNGEIVGIVAAPDSVSTNLMNAARSHANSSDNNGDSSGILMTTECSAIMPSSSHYASSPGSPSDLTSPSSQPQPLTRRYSLSRANTTTYPPNNSRVDHTSLDSLLSIHTKTPTSDLLTPTLTPPRPSSSGFFNNHSDPSHTNNNSSTDTDTAAVYRQQQRQKGGLPLVLVLPSTPAYRSRGVRNGPDDVSMVSDCSSHDAHSDDHTEQEGDSTVGWTQGEPDTPNSTDHLTPIESSHIAWTNNAESTIKIKSTDPGTTTATTTQSGTSTNNARKSAKPPRTLSSTAKIRTKGVTAAAIGSDSPAFAASAIPKPLSSPSVPTGIYTTNLTTATATAITNANDRSGSTRNLSVPSSRKTIISESEVAQKSYSRTSGHPSSAPAPAPASNDTSPKKDHPHPFSIDSLITADSPSWPCKDTSQVTATASSTSLHGSHLPSYAQKPDVSDHRRFNTKAGSTLEEVCIGVRKGSTSTSAEPAKAQVQAQAKEQSTRKRKRPAKGGNKITTTTTTTTTAVNRDITSARSISADSKPSSSTYTSIPCPVLSGPPSKKQKIYPPLASRPRQISGIESLRGLSEDVDERNGSSTQGSEAEPGTPARRRRGQDIGGQSKSNPEAKSSKSDSNMELDDHRQRQLHGSSSHSDSSFSTLAPEQRAHSSSTASNSSLIEGVDPAWVQTRSQNTHSETAKAIVYHSYEELTTKGRRRKRLAKACAACHKNKRRCDGFSPCTNCSHSGRSCVYVDSVGNVIDPPLTRPPSQPAIAEDRLANMPLQGVLNAPVPKDAKFDEISEVWKRKLNLAKEQQSPIIHPQVSTPTAELETVRRKLEEKEREVQQLKMTTGNSLASRRASYSEHSPRNAEEQFVNQVETDTELTDALLQIFFARLSPYALMFHRTTFDHRRYLDQVARPLLLIMYALAARFSSHPLLTTATELNIELRRPKSSTATGNNFTYLRGECLASVARSLIEAWVQHKPLVTSFEMSWEETEMASAIVLMAIYEGILGDQRSSARHIDMALRTLSPRTVNLSFPDSPTSRQSSTLAECRSRTLWIISTLEFGFGHMLAHKVNQVDYGKHFADLLLPGDETAWQRFGGDRNLSRDRRGGSDFLGNRKTQEGVARMDIGGLGMYLQSVQIFSAVSKLKDQIIRQSSPDTAALKRYVERFEIWSESLPSDWAITEDNSKRQMNLLESSLPAVYGSAFCYFMMHLVSNAARFRLAEISQIVGSFDRQQRSQYELREAENMMQLMEEAPLRLRQSPSAFFVISILSDYLSLAPRSSHGNITSNLQKLSRQLYNWWADIEEVWGPQPASYRDIVERQAQEYPSSRRRQTYATLKYSGQARPLPAYQQYHQQTPVLSEPHQYHQSPPSSQASRMRVADLLTQSPSGGTAPSHHSQQPHIDGHRPSSSMSEAVPLPRSRPNTNSGLPSSYASPHEHHRKRSISHQIEQEREHDRRQGHFLNTSAHDKQPFTDKKRRVSMTPSSMPSPLLITSTFLPSASSYQAVSTNMTSPHIAGFDALVAAAEVHRDSRHGVPA